MSSRTTKGRWPWSCPWLVTCLALGLAAGGRNLDAATNPPAARTGRGFSYQNDQVPEGPWSVHIVKVDRSNPRLSLHTTLASSSGFGLTRLTEQIKSLPPELGTPVAAINGDFYTTHRPYVGDPKGLQIMQGELISGPSDWTCLWIDAAGNPHMTNVVPNFRITWPGGAPLAFGLNEERGDAEAVLYTSRIGTSTRTRGGVEFILESTGTGAWLPLRPGTNYEARVRGVREEGDTPVGADVMVLSLGPQAASRVAKPAVGAVLQISTATSPNLHGVTTAIGGGPALVRGGRVLPTNGSEVRHPRTAFGWNKTHLYLVEVDGRQPRLSVGMTYGELAAYMVKLGCQEAMNLDGGGSATFWVYGQVMNSPSEGRERGMANGLILIQKDAP